MDNMEEVLYIASHDLQEPLRAIRNYAGLIAAKYNNFADDPEAAEAYAILIKNTDWATRLVSALLTYAKISTYRDLQIISIEEIVDVVKANLSLLIEEKQAIIDFKCESPPILGNIVHIQRLFQNLIHNALKYSEQPVITVTCEQHDLYVQFVVADNGKGIPVEYQEKIFHIFRRLDANTENGTGIGLAECRKIVERYGGKIWVVSKPGMGSKFMFTLPIHSDDKNLNS